MKISDTELEKRIKYILMINGIQTMEDLEKLQDGKLFEFGGIGNSALCQINLAKKLYRLEKKYGNDSTDTSKPPS